MLVFCAVLCSISTLLLERRVNQSFDNISVATIQVTAAAIVSLAIYPCLSEGTPFAGWGA